MVNVLRVTVDPPVLDEDTVTFRWTQSAPNQFQRVNEFYVRYEAIETAAFSRELYYEIFLGLQLRVFAAHPGRVELEFPSPVPRPTVDYWKAFNNAEHVTISPIAEVDSYEPWARPQSLPRPRKAAVLFGGGKDSTLAACLFSELEGSDQVVLVQFISPLRPSSSLARRLTKRQTSLMLTPTGQRLGVATQRAWTDYQAQFLPDGYHLRPNLELYTLGALPTLLTWGVSWCTFSMPWTMYATQRQRDGQLIKYRYERSRPETIADQSRHYQRVLGTPITVTNVTLPFSSYLTFRLLAERYPHAVRGIISCTQGKASERWCYRCEKCWATTLWSLSSGVILPGFDYDAYLRDSPFIHDLETYAASGVELTANGNAPWQPFLSSERGFDMVCHMIARLAQVAPLPHLSPEARANLALLRALFGNRLIPEYEAVPVRFLELLDADLASRLTPLVTQHLALTDAIPASPSPEFAYEFDGSFVPRTSTVAHLAGDTR